MKHKLLLFGASMLASTSIMAQWVQPTPTASELKVSEGTDTIVYYLYNKDAKMFFTEGNSWGTQASIGKEGLKVFISPYVASEEEEENPVWDGKTYIFNDFSVAKNAWKQVFIDSETASYVDRGSQPNYYWQIEKGADNTYRLYGADLNPIYNRDNYGETYFGVDLSSDATSTVITPILVKANEPETGGYYVDWMFVSETDYAAYQEKFAVYDAALSLQTTIDEAKEKNVDTSAAEAVYANTNSTKEEIEAAQQALKQAISIAIENTYTPDNPLDMTEQYVVNYTFDENADGWLYTTGAKNHGVATNKVDEDAAAGGTNFTGKFWENWHTAAYSGKMYKVINNVPNGIYSLSLGAFSDVNPAAYVYANNDSVAVTSDKPATYVVWSVVDANSIEIGLKKPEAKGVWMGMDNARLKYYGNSLDSYKMYISNITTPVEEYETEDVYVQKELLDIYKATIEKTKDYNTKEEILASAPAIKEANNAIQANVAAYAEYAAAVAEAEKYFEEHPDLEGEEVDLVVWYLQGADEPNEDYANGCAKYILENCLLSTEEVLAEIERLAFMKEDAINKGMKDGTDCTGLVVNADFKDTAGKGWQNPDGVTLHGGLDEFPCAEAYEKAFDVYQDVEVQNGLYEVSVNAFYRPGANGSYDGTETVPAEIYLNDFATPVQHIMQDCSEEPAYTTSDWQTDYQTTAGWVPNSMNGASTAFSAGRYKQVVYGLVTGGKLRLGIRSTATTGDSRWCLWSNFKLTYKAKNEEALASVIASFAETAEELLNEAMFAADMEALDNAVKEAQKATDGETMYDALIALNNSITTARASIAAYTNLNDALSSLLDAISEYQNTASAEALDQANSLADEINGNMDDYTFAEAEAKIEEIKIAKARLRIPAYDNPTDDNPADVTAAIENPSFENNDGTGWEGTALAFQTYTNAEHYNKNYDTYQTLYGLEAGTYRLSVKGYYRAGSAAADYAAFTSENPAASQHAFLYATTSESSASVAIQLASAGASDTKMGGDETSVTSSLYIPNNMLAASLYFEVEEKYNNSLIINVPEDGILRIGVKKNVAISNDWSIFDDFQLWYFGKNSTQTPNDDAVSIESVDNAASVIAAEYYTLGGVRVATPQKGINIVKTIMSDGTVKVSKVLVK